MIEPSPLNHQLLILNPFGERVPGVLTINRAKWMESDGQSGDPVPS